MRPTWTSGFNWKSYFRFPDVEVYKLCIVGSNRIEGAIALENRGDHMWVHLIEKNPMNRPPHDQYKYVAHHLFAFACQRHMELGGNGFVAFEAKTELISHYVKEYGAVQIGVSRMFIPDIVGRDLIGLYLY
ncbi:hypothetical protein [Paenibacillus albus]|uniref:GNAT family N-acetyltransferase n=1 Tax=Paenibacillus albus TaxID=2495582 RepID=A0A3Q8X265_9BACL|nr:hypothetical protein [Paenibacillus albus]AZN38352.1 hypothetical protein EJC50_00665 [Paenibacillus albus]